ncbi:MAG TPA: DUF2752 domain-containing protein [Thermoanaerobaculia bacterium]|nr:DUF2752 domain-containing protein [Thermoanaerobaculia bacterium]HQR66893.1 DUF2752 domain-containing protein [Thermoanaerobaculia bacterium]
MTPAVRRYLGLLLVVAGGIVLFLFDPATHGFYPPCLFKTIFGAQCPGCGSLRAMHQLLHGNLAAAWALNKPVVVGLPLAAIAGVTNVIVRRTKTSKA